MMPPLTVIFGSYQAKQFDEGTWFINFMEGSQNLYLLEGEEKALLVDTGYGTNTLAAFVKTLTDKPLLVANTHFHPDHAGGNGEFPSVMLHHNWAADANAVKPGPNLPFDISALPYPDSIRYCSMTVTSSIWAVGRLKCWSYALIPIPLWHFWTAAIACCFAAMNWRQDRCCYTTFLPAANPTT